MNFKKLSNLSLQNQLMLSYALILAMALTILGVTTFYSSAAVIKEQMKLSVTEVIAQARNNLLSYMSDVEIVLFSINNDKALQDILSRPAPNSEFLLSRDLQSLETQILSTDLFRRKTSSIQLFAIGKDRYPLLQKFNYGSVFSARSLEKERWFKDTVAMNGKTEWLTAHLDLVTGKPQISALRLIKSFAKPELNLGVVKANIDLNLFLSNIDQIKLGKSGRVFLVQGNRIYGGDEGKLFKTLSQNPVFFKTVHRFTSNRLFIRMRNIEYLIVFDELAGTGWKLVGVVPSRELLAANMSTIGKVTLFTWIFSLFIAFLFSAFLSIWILKPIYSLARVMKTFHNNLEMRVEVNSGDEIGILHQSFNKLIEKIAKLIAENNEISRREKEAELKALQAQINPHFLYNTLESINWLALKYNAREINSMVTALGNFLRHSLNKGKEFISIENEMEQVKSYLTIQKFRFKNKFNVGFEVPPELNSFTIIKLVLQPLVENAINHGFKEMGNGGEIKITGNFDGEYILLKVIDNGLGTDTELLNQILTETKTAPENISEGYGIHNVNERLKLYFGDECGLHFAGNDWGGVTATIRIKALPCGEGLPKNSLPKPF